MWEECGTVDCEEETVVCATCGKTCEIPTGDYHICVDCYSDRDDWP
jgi:hypothetical protein